MLSLIRVVAAYRWGSSRKALHVLHRHGPNKLPTGLGRVVMPPASNSQLRKITGSTDRGAKIGLWRCQRGLSRACRSPFWECKKHNNANRLLSRDCFYQLHQLRTVARSLTASATSTLIHAFITTRIDYCCSLYAGFASVRLRCLDRILRSAARFVGRIPKLGHVSK